MAIMSDTPIELAVPAPAPSTAKPSVGLSEAAVSLLAAGLPANTRRAYAADRAEWAHYAESRGVPIVPVSPELLVDFVALLLAEGSPVVPKTRRKPLAASSVERRLSAISALSVEHGHGRPDLRAARVALRGHRRQQPQTTRQAAPVTVPVLRALVAQAASDVSAAGEPTLRSLRDRGLILLGFAVGARRSELVAIDIEHVREDPGGLRVAVLRSKTTDHLSDVKVPWASDPALCPVRATLAYRNGLAARDAGSGALFRRIARGDGKLGARLTGEAVGTILKKLAAAADVPVPDGFGGWSAHSLRRGMATEARRHGADPLRIARQGGWADNSSALAGYLADVDGWDDHPLSGVL